MLDLLAVDRVRFVRPLDDAARHELGNDPRTRVDEACKWREPERNPADLTAGEATDRGRRNAYDDLAVDGLAIANGDGDDAPDGQLPRCRQSARVALRAQLAERRQ